MLEDEIADIDARLSRIRAAEQVAHTVMYTESTNDTNSWLHKPVKAVQEVLPLFRRYKKLRVLDLGCGIGRNAISIAEYYKDIDCTIDGVDLLEVAITKFEQNAKAHHVDDKLTGIVQAIENYTIAENSYDLIISISALEHIDTETRLIQKLLEIKRGLRPSGIGCFLINSDIREINPKTGDQLEPQFEINLPTEKLQLLLDNTFHDWEILKNSVSRQEYNIPRGSITSRLCTNVVSFVARRTE